VTYEKPGLSLEVRIFLAGATYGLIMGALIGWLLI